MLGLPSYLECVTSVSWDLLYPVFFSSPKTQYFFVLCPLQELVFAEINARNACDEFFHLLMCSFPNRLAGTSFILSVVRMSYLITYILSIHWRNIWWDGIRSLFVISIRKTLVIHHRVLVTRSDNHLQEMQRVMLLAAFTQCCEL